MNKIPVYFMPGLAASPKIFENINLPEEYECHYLSWILPKDKNETVKAYATRLAQSVKHDDPVLIGVSFGGVIVQEMAGIVNARRVIIISSVRCNTEFPKRMQFAKKTHAYRFFPTGILNKMHVLRKLTMNNSVMAKRLDLYEKFIHLRDKKYLDWAFKTIINWDRCEPDPQVVQVHGDADEVFPPKYLDNFIPVRGGTHIMIINKAKWLNKHLPDIIKNGSLG
ncbi:alpha/beta hydrolase [Flavobacterium rhizosphaerae]|uniref:Alpha/beta hydrolase n=1 Tax=Flavobacterium rhizosphaerae TaxID=3163298 RepID=A0ABW8YYD9_9FLAO